MGVSVPDLRRLLEHAARSIYTKQGGESPAALGAAPGLSDATGLSGLFITWKDADGTLRGCIGTLGDISDPLEAAARMAHSAAFRDPRFPPIPLQEFANLWASVSVLGPLREWSWPRDPAALAIGDEGLQVERGSRRGLLLPQVAPEWGYDGPQFLAATCRKAQLPPDAWEDSATRVQRFFGWEDSASFTELVGEPS